MCEFSQATTNAGCQKLASLSVPQMSHSHAMISACREPKHVGPCHSAVQELHSEKCAHLWRTSFIDKHLPGPCYAFMSCSGVSHDLCNGVCAQVPRRDWHRRRPLIL